jgi:predicted transcriptional regulator
MINSQGSTVTEVKNAIHNMFLQKTELQTSESIKSCIALGNLNREVFESARRQGKRCRDAAVWIGLER